MKIHKKNIDDKSLVFTTERVNEIIGKENLGLPLKRHERLWFKNNPGVRKPNIPFALTNQEIQEYASSKLSVHYFAEKFCKIKREDGTIGPMRLREYQKKIIDLYTKNRFSILMASRQVGKCVTANSKVTLKVNGEIIQKRFIELYYEMVQEYRKLYWYEKLKILCYNIIDLLD